MIISIRVPDEVYEAYGKMHKSPQVAMELQLARFKDVPSYERALIFSGDARKRMEVVFEKPIEDHMKFAEWVAGLKELKIADASLTLSEGVLKRVKAQADFRKQDFPSYLRERISSELENLL